MTASSKGRLSPLLVFAACVATACVDPEHPPPVNDGGGGHDTHAPPEVTELGGAMSNAGTSAVGGVAANDGGTQSALGGFSGDTSSGGPAGTSSWTAGDTSSGGASSAGTVSALSGSFSLRGR